MFLYIELMFSAFTEGILDFLCQFGENIIIGRGIVVGTLFLLHRRGVNQRHQRYCMITLAPLIGL